MVGLVVVSHSKQAAAGIREIAQEMGGDARIEAVGGTEDGRIGTTPGPIGDAIAAVAEDAGGVVVLVDLGSAVLPAELAIETAEVDDVAIADAPILEGALNASVAATAADATLDSVRSAAEDAADVSKV